MSYGGIFSISLQGTLLFFCSVISTNVGLVLQKSICKRVEEAVGREREEEKREEREREIDICRAPAGALQISVLLTSTASVIMESVMGSVMWSSVFDDCTINLSN